MENNRINGTSGGSERISGERVYALLKKLSDDVRQVDLQVRALNRRLDALQKETKGG
ncbi:MAG: hypothetical protein IJT27_00575 [Clostridia bacterium]|nr:hypothetical protein [Clostridia bacterium]